MTSGRKRKSFLSDRDCIFHASQIVLNIHSPASSLDQINTISDSVTVHFTVLISKCPFFSSDFFLADLPLTA